MADFRVYVVRSANTATPVYVNKGDETTPSMFWPEDAIDGSRGLMVTTVDGELYTSGSAGLELVSASRSLHVFSFAGGCT